MNIPLHFFGSLQLILNKVLLLGSASQTIVGRPIVPDAAVHAVVEEHVSAEFPVTNKLICTINLLILGVGMGLF